MNEDIGNMFKPLNLEKKVKIQTRFCQSVLSILAIIAVIDCFKVQFANVDWSLTIGIIAMVGIIGTEAMKKWIRRTIANPIYNAVMHTNSASKEVSEVTKKQEVIINKYIESLNNAAKLIEKLSVTSLQTKTSAMKVSEKSQESLSMSSKEQEAVTANIEKMRTLRQKIQIIA